MAMHLIPASDEEMQKVYQRCLFLNVAYKNGWRKSIFDSKENIKLKHMYGTTAELSWVVQTKQVFTFLLVNYRHTIMDNKIMALSCVTLHIKCQISWRARKNLVSLNPEKKKKSTIDFQSLDIQI